MGNLFSKKQPEDLKKERKKTLEEKDEEENIKKMEQRAREEKFSLNELKNKLSKYTSTKKEMNQIKIFQKLSPINKDENLIYAPIGIDMLLSLCLNGTSGEETLQEMLTALNYSSVEEANKVHFDILEKIKKYGPNLKLANLVLSKIDIKPNFNDITNKYESKIEQLENLEQINAWAKEKTGGKIDKILDSLHPLDGLILLNAIYFEAKWADKFFTDSQFRFIPKLIEGNTFYNGGDKSRGVVVEMIFQNDVMGYYENEQFQAINIKYQQFSELSAVVILPKENIPVDTVIENLNFDNYYNIILELKQRFERVNVTLPKFEIRNGNDLKEIFNDLGIKKGMTFDAEFKGISDEPILYIKKILQKCYIKVDEEGTIATACSTVVGRIGCALIKKKAIEFKVNRPFLFIIKNDNFMLGHDILFCSKICKLEGIKNLH